MNGVYVGGAFTEGAFRTGRPGPNPPKSGGDFYVTSAANVRFNDRLMVFASARAGDYREGGTWNHGASLPDPVMGVVRPGYFIVQPPRPHPTHVGYAPPQDFELGHEWGSTTDGSLDNAWDPARPPSYWGNLDARYFKKVTTCCFDGHVEMLGLERLRDMRRWSNFATSQDWDFVGAR